MPMGRGAAVFFLVGFLCCSCATARLDQKISSLDNATRLGALRSVPGTFTKLSEDAQRHVIDVMIETLRDPDYVLRAEAACALGKIGPLARKAIPNLVELLTDKPYQTRFIENEIVGSDVMVEQGQDGTIHEISDTSRRWDPKGDPAQPAAEAAGALRAMGSLALPHLLKALQGKNKELKRGAAVILSHINMGESSEEAVPVLIEALADQDPLVRVKAVQALASLGSAAQQAIPALIEKLRDEDSNVYYSVPKTLIRIGPAAISNLIRALKVDDPLVRSGASRALAGIGAPAVDALKQAVKDRDKTVRYYAARALSSIGSTLVK